MSTWSKLIDGRRRLGIPLTRFGMLRGAGSLVLTALCVQGLAVFVPPPSDPCVCSDSTCCRTAKRPVAPRASCHDEQTEPAASLRCHHPEQDVRLPAAIAVLPASTAVAPAWHAEAVAGRSPTSPLTGFSRLDLPPPRVPRAA
jgi:hypothetical protein